jgi:uncharacterized protein YcbX
MARIAGLRLYPLKGARGKDVEFLEFEPEVGVIGDRRYAFKRKETVADGCWSPKGMFYVGMNAPQMAAHEGPLYDQTRKTFDDGTPRTGKDLFDDSYRTRVADELGLLEPPAVLDTNGTFNITDTSKPSVSFLNLASVRELGRFMGEEIDPHRFRMNVHLEGLDPFEELTWVDGYPGKRTIRVDDVAFRIDDACERCKAVEANPETGTYDLPILEALAALMHRRGYPGSPHRSSYAVMGILACPETTNIIYVGDEVQLSLDSVEVA